ncbi:Dbl homology domain-containing protein [Pilobolus umbonatus]|nr:Dbl homology domain-containing protein [Pilobolus umbonatus]
MPPYSFPTFEELQAKEWAFNTIDSILTDVSPVSLEIDYMKSVYVNKEDDKKNKSILRRSLSILDTNFAYYAMREHRNSTRRSNSTIITSTNDIKVPNQSIFHSPSLTTLNTWHEPICIHHPQLLSHKKSTKALKGINTWKNTYEKYLITPSKPITTHHSIQLKKFILNELLTTEETYLEHLMTIKNFYMDPLFQTLRLTTKRSILNFNSKDAEIIFAFIPELISLTHSLVQDLRLAITGGNDVGKVFCEYGHYFEVYISYAVNFSKSRKYINKASSSLIYRQLIKDSLEKKDANRMVLADYMIAPIQRITRYCLLLKDLQKHSTSTDNTHMEQALKCLSALAFAMNKVQK